MKVFFTAGSDVGQITKKRYKAIIVQLEKLGHKVEERIFTPLIKRQLRSERDYHSVYKDILRKIDQSEFIVAEISHPSGGVGFTIYHALAKKKPVLCLVFKGKDVNPSVIIQGGQSKLLTVFEYYLKNLEEVLSNGIKRASSYVKTRFNLIIDNVELALLDNEAKRLGVSRTRVIRKLIREQLSNSF